jgi:tRNA U34 2-thiouridine synthase MnmA/TrmU
MKKSARAVCLFSGGLDSILASKIIAGQGIEIIALHIYTGFNGSTAIEPGEDPFSPWKPSRSIIDQAGQLGINLLPLDISDEYPELLLNPSHGYGSGANPCLDCRILFLTKAREVMEKEGASFVFTGEVLGQRPMTQHKNPLAMVEKRSGLKGRLLRPLSAKLLAPTIPETDGIVDREKLFAMWGRSRKPQMELAARYGIIDYPSPMGGCILTHKSFMHRFHELAAHSGETLPSREDLYSLKTGRHLRLPGGTKLVVGRNETENNYFCRLLRGKWLFEVRDFEGPSTFAMTEPEKDDFRLAAAITAGYSKGRDEKRIVVLSLKDDICREIEVSPVPPKQIENLIIC